MEERTGPESLPFYKVTPISNFLPELLVATELGLLCASCGFSCFADGGNLNDIEQVLKI